MRVVGGAAAKAQIDSVNRSVESMRKVWGAITGVVAGAGVTTAIRTMLQAAEDSRVATYQLDQAVRLIEGSSSSAAAALARQASELQSLTGVADETAMAAQRMLLSLGATTDQVEKLTPLVLDVAAAMGTEVPAAARMLGAALRGQEVSIGSLNLKVRNFDDLLEQLNARFRGQAEALKLAKGPFNELNNSVDDLNEKLGNMAAWQIAPVVRELSAMVDLIQKIGPDYSGEAPWWANPLAGPMAVSKGFRAAYNAFTQPSGGASGRWTPEPVTSPVQKVFDEEEAAIEAERARQLAHAQQLLQVEADINGMYSFRRATILSDPSLGAVDQRRMLLAVAKDEVATLREREALLVDEYQRALRSDPGRTLDTTVAAGKEAGDATATRIATEQQIQFLERYDSFSGALVQRTNELKDAFGSMARNMANVTFDTITAGVEGLGNALTGIIMGAKTAAQAFTQFGVSMLTNFIQMITTSILYAKVAIPVLTALGVLSGGATAATGAGVTVAALGAGSAAAAAAAGGTFAAGGYTGNGPASEPAGIVHRGEWVVPAWRTREIGVPTLAAMTYGREEAGPASAPPTRIIIVDDRQGLDRLMRDPRFRNAVVDMAQQG